MRRCDPRARALSNRWLLLVAALALAAWTSPTPASAQAVAGEEYGPPIIGGAGSVKPYPNPDEVPTIEIPPGKVGPKIRVDGADHDWGELLQGAEYTHTFVIHNDGDMVLKITNVKPG